MTPCLACCFVLTQQQAAEEAAGFGLLDVPSATINRVAVVNNSVTDGAGGVSILGISKQLVMQDIILLNNQVSQH